MEKRRRRSSNKRQRLTPEQRAQFARERREMCGKLLTQEGFEGALVLEHLYLIHI